MQISTLSISPAGLISPPVRSISTAVQLRTSHVTAQNPKPFNLLLQNAIANVRKAKHLQDAGLKKEIERMLRELFKKGFISVKESDANRYKAVAGVQWAMEKAFSGTEYIITKERTTPLRKEHTEVGQLARRAGLLDRLNNKNPLYLFFCQDGEGTAAENEVYQREIFRKYGASSHHPVLFEHKFSFSKNDPNGLPNGLSGAIILGKQGSKSFAFGIRASQANDIIGSKSLELSFGEVRKNPGVHSLKKKPDTLNTANRWVNEWATYLMKQTGIDIFKKTQVIQPKRQPLRASYI